MTVSQRVEGPDDAESLVGSPLSRYPRYNHNHQGNALPALLLLLSLGSMTRRLRRHFPFTRFTSWTGFRSIDIIIRTRSDNIASTYRPSLRFCLNRQSNNLGESPSGLSHVSKEFVIANRYNLLHRPFLLPRLLHLNLTSPQSTHVPPHSLRHTTSTDSDFIENRLKQQNNKQTSLLSRCLAIFVPSTLPSSAPW